MKLLLADDHTLFRDALVLYIKRDDPDAQVNVGKDFYEVQALMEEDPHYDLVLLDLRMPGMKGLDGFSTLRQKYPKTPVALMSGVAERQDVEEAMRGGAIGYFPKTLSGKALLKAIQLVMTGEKFVPLDNDAGTIMPSYYTDEEVGAPGKSFEGFSAERSQFVRAGDVNLTPREAEVLSFLAQGASNKEIANELKLQVVTVKLHVRGICRKLDVKNRTQAALRARELGVA